MPDITIPSYDDAGFNLRQLRVFHLVTQLGSIRAAARHLCMTQPAVTYTIRELELAVGAPLVERSHRGVTLTDLGQTLRIRAASILTDLARAQREIIQARDQAQKPVVIACHPGSAMQLLTQAIQRVNVQHPHIQLWVNEYHYNSPVDLFWQTGQSDLVVVNGLGNLHQDGLTHKVLMRTPLVVTAREDHPLMQAKSMTALRQSHWMVPPYGPNFLNVLRQQLGAEPVLAPWASYSIQLALAMVRNSDVLALFTDYFLQDRWLCQGLKALRMKHAMPTIQVTLTHRANTPLTPWAQQVSMALEQVVQETTKG